MPPIFARVISFKGLISSMPCFLPSGYFSLGCDAEDTEGEGRGGEKKEKAKRHDLLGPTSIAKLRNHFSPTKGAFSLSKQGQDRSRKWEWMRGHHSSVDTVPGSAPSPLVPMQYRVTGSTLQVRAAMWVLCRAGGSQGMNEQSPTTCGL